MTAADSPLSLDVLCLYVLAWILLGIVVLCRNNARSALDGSLRGKETGIISVHNVIIFVAILLLLLNTRNLILLLLNVLLSLIVLNVLSLP
jgi:hypothetical protein